MATVMKATGSRLKPHRVDIRQYLAMIGAGVFRDAHVELLGGIPVEQMTKYAPHNFAARQLGLLLSGMIPTGWLISEEKSLALSRLWRPEPDIAIIRGPNDRYRHRDPIASDVALLIEVADSSYASDRGEKWRAYASSRIPVYWIANLNRGQIEVYRGPIGRGKKASYLQLDIHASDDEVPVVIDGREAGRTLVRDILP